MYFLFIIVGIYFLMKIFSKKFRQMKIDNISLIYNENYKLKNKYMVK